MPAALGNKIKAEDDGAWPGDYMKELHFTDFRDAEKFAIDMAKDDYFGCTSVHRAECEHGKYDWWDNTGNWEVLPETKPGELDPENPDN